MLIISRWNQSCQKYHLRYARDITECSRDEEENKDKSRISNRFDISEHILRAEHWGNTCVSLQGTSFIKERIDWEMKRKKKEKRETEKNCKENCFSSYPWESNTRLIQNEGNEHRKIKDLPSIRTSSFPRIFSSNLQQKKKLLFNHYIHRSRGWKPLIHWKKILVFTSTFRVNAESKGKKQYMQQGDYRW